MRASGSKPQNPTEENVVVVVVVDLSIDKVRAESTVSVSNKYLVFVEYLHMSRAFKPKEVG